MTKLAITPHRHHVIFVAAFIALVLFTILAFSMRSVAAQSVARVPDEHIITLHDDGIEKGFITKKDTLREALADQGIRVDERDITEPAMDEKLVAASYEVNIYRARMVIVRDGSTETKLITAYRTGKQIAMHAGISLHDEDIAELKPSGDIVTDGAAEVMTVVRATGLNFEFYGKSSTVYTHAKTVGAMLRDRGINLGKNDGVSPALDTSIVEGMSIRLWRNGIQTITVDEDVAFPVEQRRDVNRSRGYREVVTKGENGRRTVSYEINMQNGKEVARKEINSNITKQPVAQVEIIGAKGCSNNADTNRALGHQMMLAAGFGEDQWTYLDKLWTHESGWIECKANYGGSGAYGIPQALPGSKMGVGWQDDPEVQIRWGLGYIRGCYTNPEGAYNHWRLKNWY